MPQVEAFVRKCLAEKNLAWFPMQRALRIPYPKESESTGADTEVASSPGSSPAAASTKEVELLRQTVEALVKQQEQLVAALKETRDVTTAFCRS